MLTLLLVTAIALPMAFTTETTDVDATDKFFSTFFITELLLATSTDINLFTSFCSDAVDTDVIARLTKCAAALTILATDVDTKLIILPMLLDVDTVDETNTESILLAVFTSEAADVLATDINLFTSFCIDVVDTEVTNKFI